MFIGDSLACPNDVEQSATVNASIEKKGLIFSYLFPNSDEFSFITRVIAIWF